MNYDANIFCEIIESIQGISFLRQEEKEGLIFRFYQGFRGLVIIDYDDDNFTDNIGKGYLMQLGIEHLIPSMYPNTAIVNPLTPIIIETVGIGNDCETCKGVGQMLYEEKFVPCNDCNGTGTKVAS